MNSDLNANVLYIRLAPLTNDHGDISSPKSLLPIANTPMISFPLTWLEEAGITSQ